MRRDDFYLSWETEEAVLLRQQRMVLHGETHLGRVTALVELSEVNGAWVHRNSIDCEDAEKPETNWDGLVRSYYFDGDRDTLVADEKALGVGEQTALRLEFKPYFKVRMALDVAERRVEF